MVLLLFNYLFTFLSGRDVTFARFGRTDDDAAIKTKTSIPFPDE